MRTLIAVLVLLAVPVALLAQPWRYVDEKGQVHYTSNVDELPKARRDQIVKSWGDAGVPPSPERAVTPEKTKKVKKSPRKRRRVPIVDQGDGDDAPERAPVKKAEPKPDAAALLAAAEAEVSRLAGEVAAARTRLDQARRKALLVPSGMHYAARNEAEAEMSRLEAELTAAKAKAAKLK